MAVVPTGVNMVPMPAINDLKASTASLRIEDDDTSIVNLSPASPASPSSASQKSDDDNDGKEESVGSPKKGKRAPVNLRSIDPKDLQVAGYNEGKSLAIYGDATRLYVEDLKALNAVFVKWLHKVSSPGWSVSLKRQDEVMEWFETIQSGEKVVDFDAIEKYHAEKAIFHAERRAKSAAISGVPTISNKGKNDTSTGRFAMQTVIYKIPRPFVGLKTTLKVGEDVGHYIVDSVVEWKGSVVEAIIHPVGEKDTKSKIVPVRNVWKIWGYNNEHTIRFNV